MKRKLLIFSLLFMFVGISINAQTITGKILEADTDLEIVGAAIIVKGTAKGTVSSYDGSFKLVVPAGANTIEISFLGFIDQEIEIDLKAGETKDLGDIKMESNTIGLEELKIVASYAVDRQTPVSISKIDPIFIEEKLGSQEFPEILKSTPSVYATKSGGGYGDGRINMRGFDSNNIGVLINGVPVNDMESGKVYWSNWAGLSDVTRTMQVQRGLGASKLAISSVGGTINILTNTTDVEKGGTIYYGIGNDHYMKTSFTVSTGLTDNNWAITLSGARTTGDGYVRATNYEAWSYFANISKRLSDKQQISFTAFGAPQWHNQRNIKHPVSQFIESPLGAKYNTDFGYRNGEIYSTAYAYNYYHKPQLSLNHFYQFNDDTKLSTAVYASFGRGGGRRVRGTSANTSYWSNTTGMSESAILTNEGLIDWNTIIDNNIASLTGSKAIISNATNSHDWYGFLTSLNTKINNIQLTIGLDGRYYKGYHYEEVNDLLGGSYYLDAANINRDPGTPLQVGDKFSYYNLGIALWGGMFVQAEYITDKFSAFVSATGSDNSYQRIDYFKYAEGSQKSEWASFFTYSAKGGANYNLTDYLNVFANGGYFTRAPYFNAVFFNNTNTINSNVEIEDVASAELGIGYDSKLLSADLIGYYTIWNDRALTRTVSPDVYVIKGLDASHKGIEFELTTKPFSTLEIKAMASVGNWIWKDTAVADLYNEAMEYQSTQTIYSKDLHVGDAAQTTASLGITWEALPKFKIGCDFNHYDRIYSLFNIENRTVTTDLGEDAWMLPDYQLIDLNISYKFDIGELKATIYGNVNNLLNTEYISDATDGNNHDAFSSLVYYGFGRTWTAGLKVKF